MISILKITKRYNSAKICNFHTNHIQNYKGAYNRKKVEGVTVHNQSLVILLFVPSFVKYISGIISNGIKVIGRTRLLSRELKRGIIQQKCKWSDHF